MLGPSLESNLFLPCVPLQQDTHTEPTQHAVNYTHRESSCLNKANRLIEQRKHHPVAVHLQGYTHHCCIGQLLDFVPSRSVQECLCFPNIMFRLGLIEISTVDRGVISMFGVRSGLFVAMNSRGRLYGTVRLCATPHTSCSV